MTCKEFIYSAITFSICNALTNKILAIILSLIKSGLYFMTLLLLKNWYKETNKLETYCLAQFICENIILLTSVFLLILSKCLNRKNIYKFFKVHTAIIIIYLFFSCFFDVCIYAGIKYKEFPDLYRLDEDPVFNYSDDIVSYSMKKYINKETNKIDISLINDEIYNYTYLLKKDSQIYVPDPQYFQINFTDESKSNLMPYQKRHRFEFNLAMILQLANTILGFLSFFLWKSIRFKHKKLIQNGVHKKYGKKRIIAGYGESCAKVATYHDEYKEKEALKEIRMNDDFIPEIDVKSCSIFLSAIMELIIFFGSLIVFIKLLIYKIKGIFSTNNNILHNTFTLTYLGKGLYSYLIIFLFVTFAIDIFFMLGVDISTNHHGNIKSIKTQYYGGFILFTVGLAYLFFSICGILGTLFLIMGDIDSNGNLYIKTACIDSDVSCYGLFQFAPSFNIDDKKYPIIFYYISIKQISNNDLALNLFDLFIIIIIYFSQFYVTFFDKILDFNCDCSKNRFGKCIVNNYILTDESELILIDDIHADLDDTGKYYHNFLNDSYFITSKKNNNKNNDIDGGKEEEFNQNSEEEMKN